jgi:FMN phosphatase YigB (HAD superfamily)
MRIRAVTFDFWGTLYDELMDSSRRRERRRYWHAMTFFRMAGVSPDKDKLRRVMDEAPRHAERLWRVEQRTMGRRELGEHIAGQMGYRLDAKTAESLGEALAMAATHVPPVLKVGANGVLEQLRGRYKLALISDTGLSLGCALREVMRNDQVLDYFDHLTFSDETSTAKPDARQFLYTCHMLGVLPAETVHVGDLEETDIVGACKAGLRAVLLTNGHAMHKTLAHATIHSLEELVSVVDAWESSE